MNIKLHAYFTKFLMSGAMGDLILDKAGRVRFHYEGTPSLGIESSDGPVLIKFLLIDGHYEWFVTNQGKEFIMENLDNPWTRAQRKFLESNESELQIVF